MKKRVALSVGILLISLSSVGLADTDANAPVSSINSTQVAGSTNTANQSLNDNNSQNNGTSQSRSEGAGNGSSHIQVQMPAPQQQLHPLHAKLPPVVDATSGQTLAQAQGATHPTQATSPSSQTTQVSSQSTTTDTSNLPNDQRIKRLELQMANLTRMNMPQKISDVQNTLQQIQGQLQVQQHDIELINERQRSFYQDLNQRIQQIQNASSAASDQDAQAGSSSSSSQKNDTGAFKIALDALAKNDYTKAQNDLQKYLRDFPNGSYVVSVHYWLGEIYFSKKDYKNSIQQFNFVINSNPKSTKIPEAQLKIANIYLLTNKQAQAIKLLQSIKKKYPNTTAAQLAGIQLQKINYDKKGADL